MATRYYSHDPRAEWEAVERWENEGGRLRQKHDYILDAIADDYRRHMDEVRPIRRGRKPDEISHVKLFLPADKAKSISGQTLVVRGERPVPQSLLLSNYL